MPGPPPSRYRVVEEGRRLVVIDRWTTEGRPASVTPPPRTASVPAESRGWMPRLQMVRRTRFDGGGTLTTHRFYDDRGPRTIAIDAGSAATIGRVKAVAAVVAILLVFVTIAAPWLLIALAALTQKSVRKPIRAAITRWLDTVEREAG